MFHHQPISDHIVSPKCQSSSKFPPDISATQTDTTLENWGNTFDYVATPLLTLHASTKCKSIDFDLEVLSERGCVFIVKQVGEQVQKAKKCFFFLLRIL